MLLLVMSDNLFQLLFGWEGVGVCSYQLIGFWYEDEEKNWVAGETWTKGYPPSHAGMKAFIVTRVGDVGLISATLFIYLSARTLNFLELQQHSEWMATLARGGLLLPVAVMLFLGPVGKSAQFPLMEWLPEAMTGPTTVSALIHAATMVKAGIYLVARTLPIFHHALWIDHMNQLMTFFTIVAAIGATTAFLAATQAMVQREIKKVLAYSTLSQLGYMMLGLGVGGLAVESAAGYLAGSFHLMTHAVFKALLFLSAGAILHTTETKDMFQMGGLKKAMPITFRCMAVGALALSGIPPLSGFWSKGSILESVFELGRESATHSVSMPFVYTLFILAVLTAGITLFYSIRMLGVTFLGRESEHLRKLEEHGKHIHEAPAVMWVPLAILAGTTVLIGLLGPFMIVGLEEFFATLTHTESHATVFEIIRQTFTSPVFFVEMAMLALGGISAFFFYVKPKLNIASIVERNSVLRGLQKLLYNRYYINAIYYKIFVQGTIRLSRICYQWLELGGVDRFNYLMADAAVAVSSRFRKTHTGVLSYNMILIVLTFVLMILAILCLGVLI
jgi:NADH-quinone oxidoreductase subunit L